MSDYETLISNHFGTYSNQTQVVLYWLLQATQDAAIAKETPEFFISLIGVVLNVFHLIILTRKSMRNTSVNVLMTGIAFSDLFIMICVVYYSPLSKMDSECSPPSSYFRTVMEEIVYALKYSFRRVSAWLGVLMAVIRWLIIKNPLNPKYESLSQSSFSWIIILVLVVLSSCVSLADQGRVQIMELPWVPPDHCNGFPDNFTAIEYFTFIGLLEEEEYLYSRLISVTEGILKIVPTISLPFLTFLLIREVRAKTTAHRKLSQNTESLKTDHITKLVILMTLCFMITEGPIGIVFATESYLTSEEGFLKYPGFMIICGNLTDFLTIFVSLNATTHFLICLAMSSQYRACAKSLLCWKSEPIVVRVASRVSDPSMIA